AVDTDERQPEMQLPERLIHHAADHLGHPEIGCSENAKDGRDGHDEVEVGYHEIRRMQVSIDAGLRQEKAADAAADEHRYETEAEQRRGSEPQIGAVDRPEKDQSSDGKWNGDDECRDREQNCREWVHPADEHVVAPDHI